MSDRDASRRIVEAAKVELERRLAEKKEEFDLFELHELQGETGEERLDDITKLIGEIDQIEKDMRLADRLPFESPPRREPASRTTSAKCL